MRTSAAIENAETERSLSIDAARRVPAFVLPLITVLIIAVDAALAGTALIFSFVARQGEPVVAENAWAWSQEFLPYAGVLYFAIVVITLTLIYQRVYRFQGPFTYTDEAIRIFKAVSIAALLITAWAFLFRGGFQGEIGCLLKRW